MYTLIINNSDKNKIICITARNVNCLLLQNIYKTICKRYIFICAIKLKQNFEYRFKMGVLNNFPRNMKPSPAKTVIIKATKSFKCRFTTKKFNKK